MSADGKMKTFQIAIDGPVAAGKSTAAKRVAEKLGFLYVDTGAMYRAVALKAMQECVQWADEAGVIEVVGSIELELDKPNDHEKDGRLVTVVLNGKDVSAEIRTTLIGEGASVVSAYAGVREVLVAMQQNIAEGENVVMEGRDIGTRVLPKANLKIYMDASVEERVNRKWKFQKKLGIKESREEVREAMMKRDRREMTRKVDPLKLAVGGWRFDTTGLSEKQVVEKIVERVRKLMANSK